MSSAAPSYLDFRPPDFYTVDLNERVKDKTVAEPVIFYATTFPRPIDLHDVTFEGGVSFRRCVFQQNVTFRGACFLGKAVFWWCGFKHEADFEAAVFAKLEKGARSNTDNGKADFSWSRFEQNANLLWAQFEGPAFFWRTIFEKSANLGATFRMDVVFEGDSKFIRVGRSDFRSNPGLIELLHAEKLLSPDNEDRFSASMDAADLRDLEEKLRKHNVSDEIIRSLNSDLARITANMFSAEGTSFRGAKFFQPHEVKFRNLDLGNCCFLDSNAGQATFQNVTWDRQPTLFGATSRRAVCDERAPAKGKLSMQTLRALGTLYNDLRVSHEEKALFEDAMDFQYGEMETKRRAQPTPLRFLSLTAWYRYLSAYGTRPGLALLWLLIAVFLVFPGLYLWTGYAHHVVDAVIHSLETSAFMAAARNSDDPVSIAARFISGFERLLVAFQAGLFVLAVQRKFGRK